jgi:hypothetical protein
VDGIQLHSQTDGEEKILNYMKGLYHMGMTYIGADHPGYFTIIILVLDCGVLDFGLET